MNDQRGAINILIIPLIISIILFFSALAFGVWAYMERAEYKEKSDKKVAAAVAVAVERTKTDKDNEFVEKEKEPLRQYTGPEALGSISVKYPKTWSIYTDENNNRMTILGNPKTVPADPKSAYALKIEVVERSYDSEAKNYDNSVKAGKLRATAYSLPKLPKVVGVRMDGEVDFNKQGAIVLLPLRDKTIKISTQSTQFLNDFNKNILPNIVFSP